MTRTKPRFMESPHVFVNVHWDHEPGSAGVSPAGWCFCEFSTPAGRQRSQVRFMESPLANFAVHWDHEPKMHNLFICKGGILRFMESPH